MRRGLFSLVWLAAVWPAGAYLPRTPTADTGFTTNPTSWFTHSFASLPVTNVLTAAGHRTRRIWRNADGSTNLTELFYWDAKDRLTDFFSYDQARNGFYWHAEYDGLNRRLLTKCYVTTNGLTQIEGVTPTTINQYYDPEVEFLELGVAYGNSTEWKLYGPDLNGKYGGLNGVGGLDAVSPYLNIFTPVISDYRGNILGEATNGAVAWNPSRPTGYGAVPGYRPVALGHGADIVQSSAWRGRWPDVTGYYNLGLRLYDPVAGMWLSYDSTWNERDPNYLTFAGGDPINYFDSDGRLTKGFYAGWTDAGVPANASSSFMAGYYGGGVTAGFGEGFQGGASITADTLTFGGSDYIGLTESSQYQGGAYTGSRILATVGRESLIAAATLGTAYLARGGSEAAYYGYQGLMTFNAGRSGYAIGTGINQVANGNDWGYLSIAGGGLGLYGGLAFAASAPELANLNFAQNKVFTSTMKQMPSLDFSTPENGAVFYSYPNRQLALGYSSVAGKTPIDFTQGGSQLVNLDLYGGSVSSAQANYIWRAASANYASGASGNINLFVGGASSSGIFNTVEEPILQVNPAVSQWMFHPGIPIIQTPVPVSQP